MAIEGAVRSPRAQTHRAVKRSGVMTGVAIYFSSGLGLERECNAIPNPIRISHPSLGSSCD